MTIAIICQGLDFAESESTATSLGPLAFVSSGDEDGDEEEIDPYDEEYKPYKFRPGILVRVSLHIQRLLI